MTSNVYTSCIQKTVRIFRYLWTNIWPEDFYLLIHTLLNHRSTGLHPLSSLHHHCQSFPCDPFFTESLVSTNHSNKQDQYIGKTSIIVMVAFSMINQMINQIAWNILVGVTDTDILVLLIGMIGRHKRFSEERIPYEVWTHNNGLWSR